MSKAIWNGVVLAESDQAEFLDGYLYFPPASLNFRYFSESRTQTTCPWKGVASYVSVEVDGQVNRDAGWSYQNPKPAAKSIAGYYAFWKGVTVEP